jgi:predicted nucleic-acid-binding Zn-ribbon protein
MKNGRCMKCESADIVANVQVCPPMEGELRAVIDTHTIAFIIQGQESQPVRAWVCGKCGFTEFYAQHPERILAADRQYRQQESGPEVDSLPQPLPT